MKRILVLSPHPDDESIGCGGTLRQHVEAGDSVRVVFLTSGEGGGHGVPPAQAAKIREREARAATKILGIADIEFLRQPDGKLRPGKLVEPLQETIRRFRPARIYVPHQGEAHPDHRAAYRAVTQAVAGLRGVPPEIFTYEVWTPLSTMQHIVDIGPQMPWKLRAIRAHRSQCRVLDFAAAMSGLARYRGEMFCWPEGSYAEVFGRVPK